MKFGWPIRGLAAAGVAVAALGGILKSMPKRWFADEPRERLYRRESAAHAEVLERGGLVAVWTFDGADLRGWYPGQKEPHPGERDAYGAAWPGTTSVKGRFGDARRFSGRDDCYYETGCKWRNRGEDFTAALWMRPKEFPRRQDVMATAEAGMWGFRLEGERLCFDVPVATGGFTTVSCEFKRDRRWAHVAFAMDREAGEMRLWVNGERRATEAWQAPLLRNLPFGFGVASENKLRNPYCGELDDAGVWERALGDEEIRRLAKGGKPLAEVYGLRKTLRRLWRARARVWWRDVLARLRWDNWPRPWGRGKGRLREVGLSFSDSAWRHLSRGHARARASGGLGGGGAKEVAGILAAGGEAVRCRVSLFGGATYYSGSRRPAYAVWPAEGEKCLPGGARRWVLSPPESSGWLELPGWAWVAEKTGLPVAPACETVHLRVNGMERGVYLLRDFSRTGTVPGMESSCERRFLPCRVSGHERFWVEPDETSRPVRRAIRTFMGEEEKNLLMRHLEEVGRVLEGDEWSPLPRMERKRQIRARLEEFRELPAGPAPAEEAVLDEYLLAGENLSPMRVVSDVPLDAARRKVPAGAELEFKSLAPEWMDDGGRVLQRPKKRPKHVEVEARYRGPDGAETLSTMAFRIMPETYGVPALGIWARSGTDKLRRQEAVAEYYGAGKPDNEPVWTLAGTRAGQGGLRFRGNSSFLGPRRLFSLKLDEGHGLFPGNPTRSLTMINADTDWLRLLNALAFGLFREFPAEGGQKRMAPRVVWAEVYMNGCYFGLQEFCERVDEDMPGTGEWTFFRHEKVAPRDPDIRPTRPTPREGDFEGPLDAARALFEEEGGEDWAERVEQLIDVDYFIDFQLLSTLFGNVNGTPKHFLFDEIAVFDRSRGKFFYIPWDFDLTLLGIGSWIETDSDRRLWKDFPGYGERMGARWRELRRGCLSSERMRARGKALLARIEEALAENWDYWYPDGKRKTAKQIRQRFERKMDCLEGRAAVLDAKFNEAEKPESGE